MHKSCNNFWNCERTYSKPYYDWANKETVHYVNQLEMLLYNSIIVHGIICIKGDWIFDL